MNPASLTLNLDQNFLCIWYHDKDLSENIQCEMKNYLNRSFTYFRIFNNSCDFGAYLDSCFVVKQIIYIITSKFAESVRYIVGTKPSNGKVYLFQPNNPLVLSDFDKLFSEISGYMATSTNENQPSASPIDERSTSDGTLYSPPPWSMWNSKKTQNSFQYWREESPEFFLFQALSRFLLKMECDRDHSLKDMFGACRLHYVHDIIEVQKIDKIEKKYLSKNAISYYTKDSFLFRRVGAAFRSEDFENIYIFRRFIIDLHWELTKLAKKLETEQDTLQLYRGKKLRTTVIQQLKDNIGALISMNGFLSTTYSRTTAKDIFAGIGENRPNYESVLFEFSIDQTEITRTYAHIAEQSEFLQEQEVLFSIGSVWRIDSVELNDDRWWTIKLSSCNDIDLRIVQFFEQIPEDSALLVIGDLLLELGQHVKAENFYSKMLLEPTLNDETRSIIYQKIAKINIDQGRYHAAIENFSRAEQLMSKTIPNMDLQSLRTLSSNSITTSRIQILNNMGLLHQKTGNSDKALDCLKKALEVPAAIEPIHRATIHDNIGLLFFSGKQYDKAFAHFSEAVKLAQNHSCVFNYKKHCKAAEELLRSRSNTLDTQLHGSASS